MRDGRSIGALVAALGLLAVSAAGAQDLRGVELLRLDCRTAGVRSDLTLFASGMVRHRETTPEGRTMRLLQLDGDALAGYRRRIAAEDLSETDADPLRAKGLVTETCRLIVVHPGRTEEARPLVFRFGRLDSLSLALSRLVGLAHELEERVRIESSKGGLPPEYEPTPGDVLRRHDGTLFRVVTRTADRNGVELAGVKQPVTLYLALDDLSGEFVKVVERASD